MKVSKGKYFDKVHVKLINSLMKSYKVDTFTAELADFITDGNEQASKSFVEKL